MALLRPGRCCSRPQGGCLQHRTEAQRRPQGQHAGGTPALPGDTVPAVRWGAGGRLLRKPTCTLWETPVCPRAGSPPCRKDHSRVNNRSLWPIGSRDHVPLNRFAAKGTSIDRINRIRSCCRRVTSCPSWKTSVPFVVLRGFLFWSFVVSQHFSPRVAVLRRVQGVRNVFGVILERQCVPVRRP